MKEIFGLGVKRIRTGLNSRTILPFSSSPTFGFTLPLKFRLKQNLPFVEFCLSENIGRIPREVECVSVGKPDLWAAPPLSMFESPLLLSLSRDLFQDQSVQQMEGDWKAALEQGWRMRCYCWHFISGVVAAWEINIPAWGSCITRCPWLAIWEWNFLSSTLPLFCIIEKDM